MIRTMLTATNTLTQIQHQLDLIGNNLSNVGTHGYKTNEGSFHELLYQQFRNDKADQAPRQSPLGIRYGTGTILGQTQMNWKVGALQQTGRQLDFALTEPKQYFTIVKPGPNGENQTVYTRQGNFYMTPINNGRAMLVNGEGYPVVDSNGATITFNENVKSYAVRDGGILTITNNDESIETIELGIIRMERPNVMTRLSSTDFAVPTNLAELGVTEEDIIRNLQGAERNQIGLVGGALEMSNVNMQKEMTDLITAQRSYQFNARSVTLADQMLGLINNIR